MPQVLTSARGLLSLLDEPQPELQVYALTNINLIISQFWAEISEAIPKIEALYDSDDFQEKPLAALVASKVYYHLGEFEESLTFALGASELFDPSQKSEYVQTILAKAIDRYISLRCSSTDLSSRDERIDPRLQNIVERMFQRCFEDKEWKQAIGIALESRRLDIIEAAVNKANSAPELLAYIMEVSMTLVQTIDFRNQILKLLVKMFQALPSPDHISISLCYVHMDDPSSCADLLNYLLDKGEKHPELILTAYQIAFDVEDSATQSFIQSLLTGFPSPQTTTSTNKKDSEAMEVDPSPDDLAMQTEPILSSKDEKTLRLRSILSGEQSIRLKLEFLARNSQVDLAILKGSKNALDSRNSLFHQGVSFANAIMHCGTTSDQFLRLNMEWLSRASNWAKFTAIAALGVIHKGNIENSMSSLSQYLPQDSTSGSPYSEGGSLFALGLIHANHGGDTLDYLLNELKKSQSEIIQHGAALGLGVAGMATNNDDIYDQLKNVLFSDNAVAGEAAGVAMGLIKLGTASSSALEEMLQYAHETQHEKIIRGLAIGIALLMYGKEDKAESLIEQLCRDKDPILRYGGMFAVGMAYCGTGNNKAIKRLLHVAVSDVSDDVRRAAVCVLGFILFKTPRQVPRIVQLLSESYNPHVRYGATLALGISCSGTGLMQAIELLEPMTQDPVEYVRQGALIALAMILIQKTEASNSRVSTVRKMYETIITDKHEDQMAKFGAVIGQGILDAGGRNATISLQSQLGFTSMTSVVGMLLFTQFWYWFPFTHFVGLCLTPTTIIGITEELKVPKFEIQSNGRPSLFAYPPKVKAQNVNVVEKVAAAVLSTTAKAAKLKAKKKGKLIQTEVEHKEKDENDNDNENENEHEHENESMEVDGADNTKSRKKEKEPEPSSSKIGNMSRVLPAQLPFIEFLSDCRYVPIKKGKVGGVLLVHDKQPNETQEVIFPKPPSVDEQDDKEDPASSNNTPKDNEDDENNKKASSSSKPQPPPSFEFNFGA